MALAKSPVEIGSRLRASPFQGPPLGRHTSPVHAPSRSHRRGHTHVETCSGLPATRNASKGLWEEPTPERGLFPKHWAACLIRGKPGSGPDRSGDGGRMRAREHGHARCGLRSGGSGELPPCEAGSLFQPDSSPPPALSTPKCHRVSRRPSSCAPIATSRRGETTPRGAGIPGAHAPTPLFQSSPVPLS